MLKALPTTPLEHLGAPIPPTIVPSFCVSSFPVDRIGHLIMSTDHLRRPQLLHAKCLTYQSPPHLSGRCRLANQSTLALSCSILFLFPALESAVDLVSSQNPCRFSPTLSSCGRGREEAHPFLSDPQSDVPRDRRNSEFPRSLAQGQDHNAV